MSNERTTSDDQTRDQTNAPAPDGQSPHEPREFAGPGEFATLPKAEFMMPGPDRDRLVGLILDGTKTATAALLLDYTDCGDPLPKVGDQSVLVDSDDRGIALLVTTAVDVVRLGDVTDQQAIDEGEGDTTAAEWRRTHESFWNSPDYRTEFSNPDFPLDDDTLVVLEHFTVAAHLQTNHHHTESA
ncbi:ASCH domain-containing protein [Bifidobacterium sp. UTBIF-78]|uniref:ASCH domain-containing protein n=1 Tax=Bifidobacterium sp. UTBIF-78 TaxID=1465263 RepID=UPI00112B1A79|nr:ASCH domain-containing protein [Bifidobacterium sp. UTBIF-78]TPF95325.1 RNA-binding protein [Bifidobacterium sp. UTBIF-78]